METIDNKIAETVVESANHFIAKVRKDLKWMIESKDISSDKFQSAILGILSMIVSAEIHVLAKSAVNVNFQAAREEFLNVFLKKLKLGFSIREDNEATTH